MRTVGHSLIHEEAPPTERAASIKACLDYLYAEALAAGSNMGAHLIGAASAAMDDEIRRGTFTVKQS
jgi:hypothetical protein